MRKKEACEVGVHPFVPADELTRAGESEPRHTTSSRQLLNVNRILIGQTIGSPV
jgi:hypothetical protein